MTRTEPRRRVPVRRRTGLDDDALAGQPHAGKVLAIDGLGFRGLPCLPYHGQVAADETPGQPGRR
jgi:hypothetical protein